MRLISQDYRDRFAAVLDQRNGDNFSITIRVQGPRLGRVSSLRRVLQLTLHGRGALLAMRAGFPNVEYRGTGRAVSV